jgi:hypothetical protein
VCEFTLDSDGPGNWGKGGLARVVLQHLEGEWAELDVLSPRTGVVMSAENRRDALAIV